MSEEPEERLLAEDFSIPVVVQPGVDFTSPPSWTWHRISASQPNNAILHLTHSDACRVIVDVLLPSDSPTEAPFSISEEIPIIIIDSLDKYWAAESRTHLPLHGLRVPVEHDTKEGAKRALAADLAAQLRLLLLLSTSRKGEMAPQLRENLVLLSKCMVPRSSTEDNHP